MLVEDTRRVSGGEGRRVETNGRTLQREGKVLIKRDTLLREFAGRYGRQPRLFRAPGRVNLIGEHTDYNDGFVLPLAIGRETIVAAAPRAGRIVRACSLNVGEAFEFDLDAPGVRRRGVWHDYVEGVARVLEARGVRLGGADVVISSDVPTGAGLSSSAALEVSVALALVCVSSQEAGPVALALAGQQAEHEYVGAKCGIMDQLVVALARAGHALLIDCRTLDSMHIPLDTSEVAVAICDTRVKHELSSSEYNLRREECERGVEQLRRYLPDIRALRDVTVEQFGQYEGELPELLRRRCRHVVTENARTLAAAEALRRGRLDEVGRLMGESHRSLRDDYEVSCRELDVMVEAARGVDGVLGARMTGGGFGGATVNLVCREALEEFERVVAREYAARTGIETSVYVTKAVEGAKELK